MVVNPRDVKKVQNRTLKVISNRLTKLEKLLRETEIEVIKAQRALNDALLPAKEIAANKTVYVAVGPEKDFETIRVWLVKEYGFIYDNIKHWKMEMTQQDLQKLIEQDCLIIRYVKADFYEVIGANFNGVVNAPAFNYENSFEKKWQPVIDSYLESCV